ncbi:MAG: phenylalanine--tRNA ligase subunit beta [Pseudomonadota bacterium]
MKFSENWLRSWVNPDLSSDALAHALTMAGLEVEGLESVAPDFNDVVIAEVLEVVKHPDADRLNVCQVNVGEAQPLNIVCGAANVAVGIKVPCARIGAVLPGDFKIKQAKVRGVASFGMLCSGKELGLVAESDGLWLLPDDAPVGKSLRDYLELDDKLITLKLTPNRSDCSGIIGVAREVAAMTGSPLMLKAILPQTTTLDTPQLPVTVDNPSACPLYCGRFLRGVNAAAPTPDWMLRRLERSGLRGINAVVDITNYVMLEMGQPMHAFDLSKLSGGIQVRKARQDEMLTLLNEQQVVLDETVLVIADEARVLAMAGIMGGKDSGVETTSRDIFLESAFFNPDAIAGRARRFGLATDSSFRFERGVDFAATRQALERATQLLVEICGGAAGEISEVCGQLPQRVPIALRRSRVARVLGISLSNEQINELFTRLQFDFVVNGETYRVTPPSYRFDLTLEADLIEELARLHGYEQIPADMPRAGLTMLPQPESQRALTQIQQTLVARDYQEIISYAFVDEKLERELCGNPQPLALQNPIASNLAVMRSSLLGGLVEALRFNLNRKQDRVRLFEIGACFARGDEGYIQNQKLAALTCGAFQSEQWDVADRPVDFYDLKADVEALCFPQVLRFVAAQHPALHPGRSAQIYRGEQLLGWIGELHPQIQRQYDLVMSAVCFEINLDALLHTNVPRLKAVAKTLAVRRDIAVLADESTSVQSLLDAMNSAAAPCVIEVALFDVYRGKGVSEGKKSLAFRVLLQDTEKTLNDAEIEISVTKLIEALHQVGAELRV